MKQEGLKLMKKLGPELRIPIHVSGPEAHITAVVQLALGIPLEESMKMKSALLDAVANEGLTSPVRDIASPQAASVRSPPLEPCKPSPVPIGPSDVDLGAAASSSAASLHTQFSPETRCVVFGMQTRAVQVRTEACLCD